MKWLNRLSISTKALLLGAFIGSILWISLDLFQNLKLDQLLKVELFSQLEQDSEAAQAHFYSAVEDHVKVVRLFAKQDSIIHFLSDTKQGKELQPGSQKWVPDIISWRGLILPSAFILYDKNQNQVASYNVYSDDVLPEMFTGNADAWLNESITTPVLNQIDDNTALIVSAIVKGDIEGDVGFITMFVNIDDHFMYNKLAQDLSVNAAAVLFSSDTDQAKILASSDYVRLPKGTLAKNLRLSYLFGAEGSNAQGDWGGIQVKLFILLHKDAKARLEINVRYLEQQQRFYAASIFVAIFTLLMVLLSRRIQKVCYHLKTFAINELNFNLPQHKAGDALANLEGCFNQLASEIVESRNKLTLQHELERKIGELKILESVTDDLGVGVLEKESGKWSVLNSPMQFYIQEIGGIEAFINGASQQEFFDKKGNRRIFSISQLETEERSLILVEEVTDLALKTEELTHMALYDVLTGLPNRVLFHNRLDQLIESSKRKKAVFAVLLIDLDRFKEVNDTLGHPIGDKLLAEVAYRFSQNIRSADTLARIGGDEFAVLLPHADAKKAELIAAKLVDTQNKTYQIDSKTMDVGSSIGIVIYPDNGKTADVIMARVDMAMYHAKRNHLGFSTYQPEIDSSDQDRLVLIADLHSAIQSNEIEVYYQPQLDSQTKAISGWEALARWKHNKRGWVSPGEFIPLAEQTGLIKEISSIVLKQAISDCSRWQSEGQTGGVSINLSPLDLMNDHVSRQLSLILDEHQLAADQVTLEVTENTLMLDPQKVKYELDLLNKLGVSLSIDDFGTGYSSLAYLKHLPMDELKIDQIFIKNLNIDSSDEAIVLAVLGLAQSLKLNVVAEGVENKAVVNKLSHLGCNIIQGFYLSKPMPFDQVVAFNLDQNEFES